jgi:RHS repeat-associated protein
MHHCPADEYCEIAASPTAADGAKVGRIYDNGSGQWKALVLSNSILLTPNKWYRISVKARAVTNLGTKYASAYLSYNATDNEGDKQVTKLVTWSASELAGGEWVRKYVIFRVPSTPNGAPNWQVSAYLYGHYGEGVIEFDDYRIEEFATQPSGPPPETRGYEYTGKKRDSATGLYYFAQRYYDPEIGRFITEDPAKDGMNWFVYCRNNPLKYVDPDGCIVSTVTGGLTGGIIGGISALIQRKNVWTGIISGFTSGAILGAAIDITVATGGTGLALVAAGAVGGGIGSGLGNLIDQIGNRMAKGEAFDVAVKNLDFKSAGISASIGVITGSFTGGTNAIFDKIMQSSRGAIGTTINNLENTIRALMDDAPQAVVDGIIKNAIQTCHEAAKNSANAVVIIDIGTSLVYTTIGNATDSTVNK